LLVEDWSVVVVWPIVEVALVSVELWLVLTLLLTDWLPSPTFTPGLMLAPTLRSLLAIPTFAPTPTFGFTFSVLPLLVLDVDGEVLDDRLPEVLDWVLEAPWFMVEVEPISVEVWLVVTPLVTVWLPSPTLMPGLMLAPRFTSVLLMPTLASTPTFGFTLSVLPLSEPLSEPLVLLEGAVLVEDDVPDEGAVVVAEVVPLNDEPEVLPEAEPWIVLPEEVVPEVEPSVEPCVPEVEPLRVEPCVPDPDVEPLAEPAVEPVPAVESGVQSMCTGLLERSFAMPVSLSASFPAFGWFSSLQRGLLVAAVALLLDFASLRLAAVSEDLLDLLCVAVALLLAVLFVALSCARAAFDAPSSAATASALI
jgi:hypothetical protein